MADITMCKDPQWLMCESCKRKTAQPSERQSYSNFVPFTLQDKDGDIIGMDCEYYYPEQPTCNNCANCKCKSQTI